MPAPKRSRRSSAGESRGLGNVETNIKKSAKKWKTAGWVKIEDGESTVVRVVDVGSDFRDGFVHPVEFKGSKSGKGFTKDVMCLDQDDDGTPCPGCRDDLDRRYKFWTRVIEREAELENDSGKVTGYEDQVKIMSGGKRLAGALNKKHKKYDLSTRDIEVEREGTGWDTDYNVEWVDEKEVPLTPFEVKMIDDSDIDLDRYATVPDFDGFYELPGAESDDDDRGASSLRRGSAFGSKSSDDDDDDTPRRNNRVKSKTNLADIRARKQAGGTEKPAIRRRRSS